MCWITWIINCFSGGSGAVVASNSGPGSTSTSTTAVAAMMDTTMERTTPSPPSGQGGGGGGTDPLGNYCKHNKFWQKSAWRIFYLSSGFKKCFINLASYRRILFHKTSRQNWLNFGAKRARLQKPANRSEQSSEKCRKIFHTAHDSE